MSAELDCPDLDSWEALFGDALPADERVRFEAHLETCRTCQETVHRAEDAGEVVRKLGRLIGDPTATPVDPALTHLLDRLREGVPAPARATRPDPADVYFLRPAERPGLLGLLGHYEVQEVIGQGGMGIVLKALDPALHRLVAIKVMNPALAGSTTARRRFTREARAAAAVSHENIIAVHGVDEAAGLPYLVMQYVAGESLQDRLERTGPLELADAVRIGLQTASGLAAAHAQGLIHRDIKPANLLLENGLAKVKITDFGLARSAEDLQITQQGVVAGTPEYMAPEQARGEAVDHRADLFSLGSVLYAMLAGQPPFQGGTPVAVIRKVIDLPAPSLRTVNPQVPEWLDTLASRLLAKERDERFQSAAEVASLLEGYLAHLQQPTSVAAPPVPAGRPSRAPLSRGLVFCFLTVILGLAGAIVLVGAGAKGQSDQPEREFYHSFKDNPDSGIGFELFGPDADTRVKFEPEGLRITLPPGPKQEKGTGVKTRIGVQGDFEVTEGFEILAESAGTRLGLVLFLEKPAGIYNMASLSRQMGPKIGPHFGTWVTLWDETAGKNHQRFKQFPTQIKKGRLRLVRAGSVLSYSVAEDGSDQFTLLQEFPFSTDPIQEIRLTATPNENQEPYDVRVTDLRVRAGALQLSHSGRIESKSWLILALTLLLAVALSFAGWFALRKRRGQRTLGARSAAKAGAEADSARVIDSIPQWECAVAIGRRDRAWLYLWLPPLAFLAVLATALVTSLVQGATAGTEHEFYHDFRGQPIPETFKLFGEPEGKLLRVEPEGLRITIPNSYIHPYGGVGLLSNFGIRGDFELTTTVEILHADVPDVGWGVGAGVRVQLPVPDGGGATVARILRPGAGPVVFWDIAVKVPEGQNPNFEKGMVPSTDRVVRLRLKRTGTSLSYAWAPGMEGGDFQDIQRCEVTTDDVQSVRLSALTGRQPYNVDARFIDLRIRSAGVVAATFHWRIWIAAAIFVLVLASCICGLLHARHKRRREETASSPLEPGTEAAPAPAVHGISFNCTACGRKLRAREGLIGKKIKCPHCGAVARVPDVRVTPLPSSS
jgi:serine/threonine-protein kinase